MSRRVMICDPSNFVEDESLTLDVTRNFYGKYLLDENPKKSSSDGRTSYIFGRTADVDTYEFKEKLDATSGIVAIMDIAIMDKFIEVKQDQTEDLVHESRLESHISGFLEIVFALRNWKFDTTTVNSIRDISNKMILWVGYAPNGMSIYTHRDKNKGFIDSIVLDDDVIYNNGNE